MKRLLFGAGNIARVVVAQYSLQGVYFDGVIVSDVNCNPKTFYGIGVHDVFFYVGEKDSIEIVLGISDMYVEEVICTLKRNGYRNIIHPDLKPMRYKYFLSASQSDYLKAWYFAVTGKMIQWDKLVGYNEKIQWLKINDNDPRKRELSDKYAVREYVRGRIGDKYLVPLLGVWENFSEIDFKLLPDMFVLKCNHGSGWNMIIRDKEELVYDEARKKFDLWMSLDYSDSFGLELNYNGIAPKIIAEKLLLIPGQTDIEDYKFFVFHGKVRMIQVDIDRSTNHKRNIYTPNWEYIPVSILYPTAKECSVPKPKCLPEMIDIAESLGKDFKHVRVDMYLVGDHIYFGEMTFYHGSGIEPIIPEYYEEIMGSWIQLED